MKFEVIATVTLAMEISDDIIALHKDEHWVKSLYNLDTPEKIAEHLAFNCGLHQRDVPRLDGFSDRTNDDVKADITWTEYETRRLEGP